MNSQVRRVQRQPDPQARDETGRPREVGVIQQAAGRAIGVRQLLHASR